MKIKNTFKYREDYTIINNQSFEIPWFTYLNNQHQLIDIQSLYKETDGAAYITSDVGQHQMFAAQYYHFDRPRQWINSGGLGTMGFGLPAICSNTNGTRCYIENNTTGIIFER